MSTNVYQNGFSDLGYLACFAQMYPLLVNDTNLKENCNGLAKEKGSL